MDKNIDIPAAMCKLGFLSPSTEFVKPDPRGREYGYYQVFVFVDPDDENPTIRVKKRRSGGSLIWTCIFENLANFACWAGENT